MSPNSSPDLLSVFSEMTGRTPAEIRNSTRSQRQALVDSVMRDRGWPDRYRQFNISNRNQLASRVEAAAQRSWFRDYIYDTDRSVISNGISIVTMRPVEGVVNSIPLVNRIPYIGKIARWAAFAAAIYYGAGALGFGGLRRGAETAYEGGNRLLDRSGVGAGNLFPGMNAAPASPYIQLPPSGPGPMSSRVGI